MPRVLYLLHSAPELHPGGVGTYAEQLYEAVAADGEFEPFIVARVGPPEVATAEAHPGSRLTLADRDDPRAYRLYTRRDEFEGYGTRDSEERLHWRTRDKQVATGSWRGLLEALVPDVVHIHHLTLLGYDLLRETRATLPDAAIIYTLHDFVPICLHDGQMVTRTADRRQCDTPGPRHCHACFSGIPPETFFLRERFVRSAMAHVDTFIAPSQTVRERYVDWGIEPERIAHEPYGHPPVQRRADPPDAGRRLRFGFFGRLTWSKGLEVILDALELLGDEADGVEVTVHGAFLPVDPGGRRAALAERLAALGDRVRFHGSYELGELPALMSAVDWVIVPSLWREVGPIVIAEARAHRRPVICSGIGSMAERVEHDVDGLHIRPGDAEGLAQTMRRIRAEPELWSRLRAAITDPHPMDRHLTWMTELYRDRIAQRSGQRTAAG
jgi:glycosyltransferase involved in cell wall biosynthesis